MSKFEDPQKDDKDRLNERRFWMEELESFLIDMSLAEPDDTEATEADKALEELRKNRFEAVDNYLQRKGQRIQARLKEESNEQIIRVLNDELTDITNMQQGLKVVLQSSN